MTDKNRSPGSQRQQPRQGQNTGAGSRQMEQQTGGGSMQQDQGRPPTSSWMEQQGGVGRQQEQGRGAPGEMPEQAGSARQQGDMSFESERGEDVEFQPEQQQGERPKGDDPDLRKKPGGMQHEAQGGAGAQPGSTGMGTDTRGGGARHSHENRDRDRGDPENR
jgi:hypothetical protein